MILYHFGCDELPSFTPRIKSPSTYYQRVMNLIIGGETGIRTQEPISGLHALQACSLDQLGHLSVVSIRSSPLSAGSPAKGGVTRRAP